MSSDLAKSTALFFSFLLLFGSGIAVALLRADPNPWISVLLVLTPPLLLLAVRRFPAAFIPPVIFAGQFKEKAAGEGIDASDPTFLCLGLLFVVTCVHLFFFFIQARGITLRYLFAGQWKVIRWFLLLEFLVAFSYLHTISPEYGRTLALKFLTIDLFLFLVPLLLFRDERDLRHFTMAMLVFAVPLALRRMMVTLASSAGTTEDITQIGAGHLIGMTILLIVNYPVTEKPWVQRLIFLTFPLLTAGLIATDARGPAFACLALLALSVFKGQGARFFSGVLAKVAIIVMMLGVVGFTVVKMTGTGNRRVSQKRAEIIQLLSGEAPSGGVAARIFGYSGAISGFLKKPILGLGAGGSRAYLATYHGPFGITGAFLQLQYPHNVVLQVAAEQGIFGLAVLLAFLWSSYKSMRTLSTATRGRLSCFQYIFMFNLFCMMFSGDLDNWRAIWLWCGVALAASRMLATNAIPTHVPAADRPVTPVPARRFGFRGVPEIGLGSTRDLRRNFDGSY